MESFGGLTMLASMLALLVYRIGTRYPAMRERMARATGVAALALAATFATLAGTMGLTTAKPTIQVVLISLVWTVVFIVVPVVWIAVSAFRCLAAAPR